MIGNSKKIAVVGQGYVGLPLAVAAAQSGWSVVGIDVSERIVKNLNSGISHIEDVTNESLRLLIHQNLYEATTDGAAVSECEICIVCVPTPLDISGLPDLSYLESAIRLVASHLPSKALLVSESTSYPGTVRDFVIPLVSTLRNDQGVGILFASAPERVDPRNEQWDMRNTPRLVSGIDTESTRRALDFYKSICETVIEVSKPEVAEMAKLLENTFRQVNIALVNQLVPFCKSIDIDMREVVEAAGSKPYGYMKFFPGAGVGGHCIPIDPLYLLWKARQDGFELPFIAKADEINRQMPRYVVSRLIEKANPTPASNLAILGVAYKSGISDVRESPAYHVAQAIQERGHRVLWSDPLVGKFHSFEKYEGHEIQGAIVVTAQSGLIVEELAAKGVPILDCTGVYRGIDGVAQL